MHLFRFFKFRLDRFSFTSMLSSASSYPLYGNVYLHFVNNIVRKTQNSLFKNAGYVFPGFNADPKTGHVVL